MGGSANAITITNSLGGEYISAGFSYQSQFAIEDDLLEAGFDDNHPYEFTSAYIVFSFTDDDIDEITSTETKTDFYDRTGPTTEYRDITTTYSDEIETVNTRVGELANWISGTSNYSDTGSISSGEPTLFGSRTEDYQYACGLFTLCDGTRTVEQFDRNYERNEGYTGSFTITHTLTGVEFASLLVKGNLLYFIEIAEGDLIFNSVSLTFNAVSLAAVPIPPALFLFGSGLLGLLRIARVRRK